MDHVVEKPVELNREEDYEQILEDLLAEAQAWRAANPTGEAQAFIDHIGRRRWMSNFADYWNIPEDEQLYRFQIRHIDRFLTDIFEHCRCTDVPGDAN